MFAGVLVDQGRWMERSTCHMPNDPGQVGKRDAGGGWQFRPVQPDRNHPGRAVSRCEDARDLAEPFPKRSAGDRLAERRVDALGWLTPYYGSKRLKRGLLFWRARGDRMAG